MNVESKARAVGTFINLVAYTEYQRFVVIMKGRFCLLDEGPNGVEEWTYNSRLIHRGCSIMVRGAIRWRFKRLAALRATAFIWDARARTFI